MRQLRRLEELARLDELQPVRNVVVDRALPLAEGISAGEAAPRLLCRAGGIVGGVDLAKVDDALLDRALLRVVPRDLQEGEMLIGHGSTRPRRSRGGAPDLAARRT